MPENRYHHGDLRAALLARAAQTLREKGAGALSLRELARDIGVSHAAPSRHFRDKRALLDALAVAGFDRLTDALERATVGAAGHGFRTRLRALAEAYVDFATHDAELLEVMYTGKHAPGASNEVYKASLRLGEVVLTLVADGQRDGDIRPGRPAGVALVMLASVHGYASLLASGMVPADGTDGTDGAGGALDEIVEHVARGLRPQRSATGDTP